MCFFPGDPSVPANQRSRICFDRLRLEDQLDLDFGPPWTHGHGPQRRVSAGPRHVVHRTNHVLPRAHLSSQHAVNIRSAMHVLQISPWSFKKITRSP